MTLKLVTGKEISQKCRYPSLDASFWQSLEVGRQRLLLGQLWRGFMYQICRFSWTTVVATCKDPCPRLLKEKSNLLFRAYFGPQRFTKMIWHGKISQSEDPILIPYENPWQQSKPEIARDLIHLFTREWSGAEQKKHIFQTTFSRVWYPNVIITVPRRSFRRARENNRTLARVS